MSIITIDMDLANNVLLLWGIRERQGGVAQTELMRGNRCPRCSRISMRND